MPFLGGGSFQARSRISQIRVVFLFFAFVHFALSSNPQKGPHVVCKSVSHERVAFNTETPGLKFFTVKHS